VSRWSDIADLVRSAAAEHGDHPAVSGDGPEIGYAELGERVAAAATATVESGVGLGDRVAIWAPNSASWIVAALGAVTAGAVLVPLNTRFKGAEAGDIVRRSRAQLLFTVRGFLDIDYLDLLAGEHLPDLRQVVLLAGEAAGGAVAFPDWASGHTRSRALPRLGPDAVGDLIYTSGTTGRPTGVPTTHGQSLRVFDVWAQLAGLRAGDRYLVVNPFFHTFGYKAGVLACLMRGATLVPEPVFEAGRVMQRIERERITVLPGPPTLYSTILDHPRRGSADLSSLRLAVTGAAVVPVELVRRMHAELGFDTVITAYGLTEATGTVTMCRPGDDDEVVARTSGRAIPDTEVRVVAADGTPLPAGERGEVQTRGYHVMAGYFEDPEATAAVLDADGWLRTGDIGVLDPAGNLTIVDRSKDMFVVGGFNAYPAEIEQVLAGHPSVAEVAVIGVPDERLGEVGAAFVVARPGVPWDGDALLGWARERLANFKVPRSVELLPALPRTASGKVAKHALRTGILT
jgi:acyl-CoA synthetase (AMP-forming)/AMP-acid ligase II